MVLSGGPTETSCPHFLPIKGDVSVCARVLVVAGGVWTLSHCVDASQLPTIQALIGR
jgi:hypothetical protein